MTYTISPERRMHYAAIFLISKMINEQYPIPIELSGEDVHLGQILSWLRANKYIDIDEKRGAYQPLAKARDEFQRFVVRLQECVDVFTVFSGVNIHAHTFAYTEYFDLDEDEWEMYIGEAQWHDLRVVLAEHKGLDPTDIVFMCLMDAECIGNEIESWQKQLGLGSAFDAIETIANNCTFANIFGKPNEKNIALAQKIIQEGCRVMLEHIESSIEFENECEEDDDEDALEAELAEEEDDEELETDEDYNDDVPLYLDPVKVELHDSDYYKPYMQDTTYASKELRTPWILGGNSIGHDQSDPTIEIPSVDTTTHESQQPLVRIDMDPNSSCN